MRISRPAQTHSQEVHIGRRVHNAQRAVNRKRIDSGVDVKALRIDGLKNISRGNVVLDALHSSQKILFAGARFDLQLTADGVMA